MVNRIKHLLPEQPKDDINVIALVKGCERYVFLYTDDQKCEALRSLGRFATCPKLSFSWYDAAMVSQRIRQQSSKPIRRAM